MVSLTAWSPRVLVGVSAALIRGGPAFSQGQALDVCPSQVVLECRFVQATHDFCDFGFDNTINAAVPYTYQGISGWALGGNFATAGGIPASRVVFFTGDNYLPLGAGLPGNVGALTIFNGDLVATGAFTTPTPGVARFDANANSWVGMGTGFPAGTPNIMTTLLKDGALHIGGTFGGQGIVLKFNPVANSWGQLGLDINLSGAVNALADFDDGTGGGSALFAGTTASPRIWKYNPLTDRWAAPSAGGISGASSTGYRVNALVPDGDKLYILGKYPQIGSTTANGAAYLRSGSYTDFSIGLPTYPAAGGWVRSGLKYNFGPTPRLLAGLDMQNTAAALYSTPLGGAPAWSAVAGASINTPNPLVASPTATGYRGGVLTFNAATEGGIPGPVQFLDGTSWSWSGFGGKGVGGGAGAEVGAFESVRGYPDPFAGGTSKALLIGYTGQRIAEQGNRGAAVMRPYAAEFAGFRIDPLAACSAAETGFIGTNAIEAFRLGSGRFSTILGGFFTAFNGSACSNVARIDSQTGCDCGPGGFINGFVQSMSCVRINGLDRVLIGGYYDNAGNIANLNFLSVYDPETNAISAPPGGPPNGGIGAIEPIFDPRYGKDAYLLGGSISQFGTRAVNNIFLYNPNAANPADAVTDTFPNGPAPGLSDAVGSLARAIGATPQAAAGPAFYAGGAFLTTAAGLTVNRVAYWDGTQWHALGPAANPGVNGYVGAMAAWDDGTGEALYLGGQFTAAGAVAANRIVKWNGTEFTPLAINGANGANNTVKALHVFDLGDEYGPCLYVGGSFTSMMGVSAGRVARIVGRGEPRFIRSPDSIMVSPGQTAMFGARAAGRPSNAYRWKKGTTLLSDGGRISGAFTKVLTITGISTADAGQYTCTVTNPFGSAESFAATLTIGCGIADVASLGGGAGADGQLTVDDIIVFLQAFFANNGAIADVASLGGAATPDGQLTVDDIIAFLGAFFAGCA